MNDLKRVLAGNPDVLLAGAQEALVSGWWLNGARTEAFCAQFAAYVGAAHCVGVANGSDALEIAYRALVSVRQPKGREIVTVPNAGGYSSIAAHLTGLEPVYADIDEASQLGSISSILSCVGPQTAFVVATHLYGGALDVPLLRKRLDEAGHRDVAILEDCAQAHGARVDGRRVGSLGDISTFSFYPTKNLGAFGDAGAVVTSDEDLLGAVNALRQYGWSSKYAIAQPFGRNSRMDEVQAAILLAQLPDLDAGNARRSGILDCYANVAKDGVRVVRAPTDTVGHLAVLLTDDRDMLRQHLKGKGIDTDIHYPVLDPDQVGWRQLPHREAPGGIPVARASVHRLLSLPCFPNMRQDEVHRVVEALRSWRI